MVYIEENGQLFSNKFPASKCCDNISDVFPHIALLLYITVTH